MAARSFRHRLSAFIVAALDAVLTWRERRAARHLLRTLDERMLKDMGLSRCDAEGEGRKPFWRT